MLVVDTDQAVKSFYSIDEPDFWENCPPAFQHIKNRQGDIAYFFLGDDADDNPTTVIALKMEPGRINARHAHPCGRFEVVVQGSLDIGERVLRPGDVMYSKPGVFYGPHVAGPEGCTTIEIFSDLRGAYEISVDTPDGPVAYDFSKPEVFEAYKDMDKDPVARP